MLRGSMGIVASLLDPSYEPQTKTAAPRPPFSLVHSHRGDYTATSSSRLATASVMRASVSAGAHISMKR